MHEKVVSLVLFSVLYGKRKFWFAGHGCGSSPQIVVEIIVSLMFIQVLANNIKRMNKYVLKGMSFIYLLGIHSADDVLHTKAYGKFTEKNNHI